MRMKRKKGIRQAKDLPDFRAEPMWQMKVLLQRYIRRLERSPRWRSIHSPFFLILSQDQP